jgi:hypothetical protein
MYNLWRRIKTFDTKCLYESVETVPFGDGPFWRKQVEVIEPRVATGKLTCADLIQQKKADWFAQNRKRQPLSFIV